MLKLKNLFSVRKTLLLSSLTLLQPLAYADIINSENLAGPLQLEVTHSSPYGFILNTHWTNYFTPANAFGFELDFGSNEFRLGGTWAHALATQQRFKMTAEHLAQRPDFGFIVADDTQWQGANAFGANYQYLLNQPYIKALNLAAYAASTEDEDFQTVTFIQNQRTYNDIQHSSGANAYGASAGLNLQFWPSGTVNIAANYDLVRYSPLYVSASNTHGLGATVGIEQLLTDRLRVTASASDLKPYREYQAKLAWLAVTHPGKKLEIAASGSRTQGDIPVGADNRLGLSLAYSWGGSSEQSSTRYKLATFDNAYDLTDWTTQPAVHLPSILAIKDEQITEK